MRRTRLAPPLIALLSALSTVLLTGCSGGTGIDTGTGTGGAGHCEAGARRAGFAEVLARSAPTADHAWYPETVTAALPSVRYVDGSGEAHASELAAVGRFTGGEPGAPIEPNLREIDLTFEVEEVIGSLGDLTMLEGGTVTVHVSIDDCAQDARVAEELLALGDVVLFLEHVGPEPWPPPEWIIVFGGAFLGDVHDDGALTWPVAESIAANGPADTYPEDDAGTLDDLRHAAREERAVDVSVD